MLLWKILALEKCLVFKTNVYDGIVGVAYGKSWSSNDKLPSIRKLFCFFLFLFLPPIDPNCVRVYYERH